MLSEGYENIDAFHAIYLDNPIAKWNMPICADHRKLAIFIATERPDYDPTGCPDATN